MTLLYQQCILFFRVNHRAPLIFPLPNKGQALWNALYMSQISSPYYSNHHPQLSLLNKISNMGRPEIKKAKTKQNNPLRPKKGQGINKKKSPLKRKFKPDGAPWEAGYLWVPSAQLSKGEKIEGRIKAKVKKALKERTPGKPITREDPLITWTSDPKNHEWKTFDISDYETKHEAIVKSECFKWGWRYAVVRKELHDTVGDGIRYPKEDADFHITLYLSMYPFTYQVEGHLYYSVHENKPLYPTTMMPEGAVTKPWAAPSREYYVAGPPPYLETLPMQWEPAEETPDPSTSKRKRSVDEADPSDPTTASPETDETEKRARRRTGGESDDTVHGN